MRSLLGRKTRAAILGGAIVATGMVGISLAGPASAAKSHNVMLTDVPKAKDAPGVAMSVTRDGHGSHLRCFENRDGKDINTAFSVKPGDIVFTITYPTKDCQLSKTAGYTVGYSECRSPVPADLTTDNYWAKVGPTRPATIDPGGTPGAVKPCFTQSG